jgi:hypothetical protein
MIRRHVTRLLVVSAYRVYGALPGPETLRSTQRGMPNPLQNRAHATPPLQNERIFFNPFFFFFLLLETSWSLAMLAVLEVESTAASPPAAPCLISFTCTGGGAGALLAAL